jgi:hypothetical protein
MGFCNTNVSAPGIADSPKSHFSFERAMPDLAHAANETCRVSQGTQSLKS